LPDLGAPSVTRDKGGMVHIDAAVSGKVQYRLNDGSWESYTQPFEHSAEGTLETRVTLDKSLVSDTARVTFEKIVPLRNLDKSAWKIVRADSVEPGEGEALHAIDNDPETFWHTNYAGEATA
jgi:beta-galactosidase